MDLLSRPLASPPVDHLADATSSLGPDCDAFSGEFAADLHAVAAKYGTPLYVYDVRFLTQHLQNVRRELSSDRISLLYSVKANSSLNVLKAMLLHGFGLDLCSPGDVAVATVAGADANCLSYTGVGLRSAEIGDLLARGIHVNLDSLDEIGRLPATAASVGLRIAPDILAGFNGFLQAGKWGEKFGMDMREALAGQDLIRAHGGRVTALHCHIGGSIDRTGPFLAALDFLLKACGRFPDVGALNLGGGIAVRFAEGDKPFPLSDLRLGVTHRLERFQRETGRVIKVLFEPGELLISEAGCLLTRVLVTKRWRRLGEPNKVAILDSSMNLMPACTMYGSPYRIERLSEHENDVWPEPESWTLFGNTNHAGDMLARKRLFPGSFAEGDLLLIRNAGAYAYARSTTFNERPRPAEVWVDGEVDSIGRPAELLDALVR